MSAPSAHTAVACTVAALLVLPAALPGQQQTPPERAAPQALPDSVQQLLIEFQEVQRRLADIQSRTVEANEELAAQQSELRETVEAVMVEADASVASRLDRLDSLETSAETARAEADTARVMSILGEVREIQGTLEEHQQAAMARDSVARQVQAFRSDLMEAMRAANPETDSLLQRLRDLSLRLQAIRGEQRNPGGS